MKSLIVFIVFFVSFSAFANTETVGGISGFFSQVMYYLHSIADFFLVDLPNTIQNFLVYVSAWLLKQKLEAILWSIEFSMSVASSFLDMLSFGEVVNSLVGRLPNDVKAVATQFAVFEALTMLIEAGITRYVYGMIK